MSVMCMTHTWSGIPCGRQKKKRLYESHQVDMSCSYTFKVELYTITSQDVLKINKPLFRKYLVNSVSGIVSSIALFIGIHDVYERPQTEGCQSYRQRKCV